jgi:hypothetical protein
VKEHRRRVVAIAGIAGLVASRRPGPGRGWAGRCCSTDIKVGVTAMNSVGTIPWAQASGIFARNGLNVTEVKVFPAPPSRRSAALAAGGPVEFAYAPSIPILNAYANGGMALEGGRSGRRLPGSGPGGGQRRIRPRRRCWTTPAPASARRAGSPPGRTSRARRCPSAPRKAQGEVAIAQAVKAAGGIPALVKLRGGALRRGPGLGGAGRDPGSVHGRASSPPSACPPA